MSEPTVGCAIKLSKFPPNRGITDWDRILHINQTGCIEEVLPAEKKQAALYLVWFSSQNKREGWIVWLAREHFTV